MRKAPLEYAFLFTFLTFVPVLPLWETGVLPGTVIDKLTCFPQIGYPFESAALFEWPVISGWKVGFPDKIPYLSDKTNSKQQALSPCLRRAAEQKG